MKFHFSFFSLPQVVLTRVKTKTLNGLIKPHRKVSSRHFPPSRAPSLELFVMWTIMTYCVVLLAVTISASKVTHEHVGGVSDGGWDEGVAADVK